MSDGPGQTAWSYDAKGNIVAVRKTISGVTKTFNYTYNLDSSIASIAYPAGRTISYTYSNTQRLASAFDTANNLNFATDYAYAAPGFVSSSKHGAVSGGFAGITQTASFTNRLQPNVLQATSSNGTVLHLDYSYDLGSGGE